MKQSSSFRSKLVGSTPLAFALAAILANGSAIAQSSSSEIDEMKRQIQEMQNKIDTMQATQAAAAPAAAKPVPASNKYEGIQAGPLNIKFGGFIEFAGIYRNRNEVADLGSSWGGIPYENASNHHLSEFRESARQSRLSLLISGPNDGHQHAEAYYEMDFLGAAQTANSKESNSYNPRIRNIYASYFNDDSGFSILAGQNWSLLTLQKKGMNPRTEVAPMTIDAQYVPGFNWTRNAQIRFVEKFSDAVSVGLSLESPQALFAGKAPTGVIFSSTGGSQFNNANSYTFDSAPDVIAKLAFDPSWGHYELYGVARQFRDRVTGSATVAGENNTKTGAGIGGSAVLPLIAKKLELQASFLTGKGVGRYGSVQLPDATFDAAGDVETIKATTALVGLIGHPNSDLDLYAYWGMEKVDSKFSPVVTGGSVTGYTGYGIPTIDLSGCSVDGGTCAANTGKVSQATIGGWWKVYRGSLGYLQVGAQASFTKLQALSGLNGLAPDSKMTVGMVSVRYYPYQN